MLPWENFWSDLQNLLLWVPRRLWELMLEALAWMIQEIPVPDWFTTPAQLFSELPEGIAWGLWLFNVSLGLSIVLAAYILRFLIRRLPVIG